MMYSVIIPVYNGENSLPELSGRLLSACGNLGNYELIFVDDGSSDRSWDILEKIKEENKETVTGIKLSRNFGQHNATMCGFFHCKGDFVITIDDDLEMLPEDIPLLVQKQKENDADLVYGFNEKFSGISLRGLLTSTYKQMAKWEGKYKGRGSSFRLMRKSLVDSIKNNAGNFIFIDEFCLWYTNRIDHLEVHSGIARPKKKSRYSLWELGGLSNKLILISSLIPLRAVTYLGLVVAALTFLLGMRTLIRKFFFDVPLGYTSVILSILFSAGLIMFSIGVLGEYLGIIVRSVTKMPPFNIEKKI